MKYLLLSLLLITSFTMHVQAQDCGDLPTRFDTYQAAINAIRSADFKYTDELPAGSSSYISTAEYFSCDGNFGYLICTTTKGGGYIYENIPKDVWAEFKNADSKGTYYEKQLKSKYKLLQSAGTE